MAAVQRRLPEKVRVDDVVVLRRIEACCHPESNVSLSFIEGVNSKIRAIHQRVCGYKKRE